MSTVWVGHTTALSAPPRDGQIGRLLRHVLIATMVVVLAVAAVETSRAVGTDPGRPDIDDFHAFTLVGRLVWDGRLSDAYHAATMVRLERALGGRDIFMPFSYPPLFGLVLAPLARLPLSAAILLFAGSTLAFFLIVLRRLAGPWFWTALLATAPAVLLDLRLGQNGLLTAALAGLSTLLALGRRSAGAGLAAGLLLALKPHLALGLPLLFLLRRDARAFWISGATAAVLSGASVALLGAGTMSAFLDGLSDTGRFMTMGLYPLHRMVSLYACLIGLGVPPPFALAVHVLAAAGVLVAAGAVAMRLSDRRVVAGLPLMTTAFLSPYLYDYDLTIFGAGLALTLPALARTLPGRRLDLVVAAIAATGGLGLAVAPLADTGTGVILSFGGPALLVCFAIVVLALRREIAAAATAAPPNAVYAS